MSVLASCEKLNGGRVWRLQTRHRPQGASGLTDRLTAHSLQFFRRRSSSAAAQRFIALTRSGLHVSQWLRGLAQCKYLAHNTCARPPDAPWIACNAGGGDATACGSHPTRRDCHPTCVGAAVRLRTIDQWSVTIAQRTVFDVQRDVTLDARGVTAGKMGVTLAARAETTNLRKITSVESAVTATQ